MIRDEIVVMKYFFIIFIVCIVTIIAIGAVMLQP